MTTSKLLHVFTFFIGHYAPCKIEFDNLVEAKRAEFVINSRTKGSIIRSQSEDKHPPPAWRPKGQLVAHLHEHQVQQEN